MSEYENHKSPLGYRNQIFTPTVRSRGR